MTHDDHAAELDCAALSDEQLLEAAKRLVQRSREDLVALLKHLWEIERRELFSDLGFSSLFEYCVRELKLSEDEAYKRIQAARAARRFPSIYRLLEAGELTLTSVRLIAPHLKEERSGLRLIEQIRGKRSQEIERLVAGMGSRTQTEDRIRFVAAKPASTAVQPLPLLDPKVDQGLLTAAQDSPSSSQASDAGPRRAESTETPAQRIQFSFSVDERVFKKFERARGLLWHKDPRGRCEKVFEAALDAFLDKHDPERQASRLEAARGRRKERKTESAAAPSARSNGAVGWKAGAAERKPSRRVPRRVQHAVWRRDEGRCAYVSDTGRRCAATSGLEFDHRQPWALGGRSDDPDNVRLLCRAHNQLLARRTFGAAADFRLDAS